jgi:hypothetical protein
MKISLLILSTLIVGIFIGKFAFSTNEVIIRSETIPIKSHKDKQLDDLAEGFYNLSKDEFDKYIQLKDESEKAEKAEEILGKVILLFLANVQMKMSSDVKNYFEKPKTMKRSTTEPLEKNDEGLWKKPELEVYVNDYKKSETLKIEDEEFSLVQKQLPMEIKSPYTYFKKAKAVEEFDKIKKFNGAFTGNMYIVAGKKKGQRHVVELSISFGDDNGKISGSYESKISYEGNLYSHNRGSGGNKQIRKAAKGLYLIEISPNSFMHLRYISSNDYFVGKFYDDDEYRGLVKLYPQGN